MAARKKSAAKKKAGSAKAKRVTAATKSTKGKPTRAKPASASGSDGQLTPPAGSVVVRMYRIGHGDCFLLAFATDNPKAPVYVLIDCGYKPGSPAFIKTTAKEVTAHIRAATGGHIHVAVITHEHQDHVNGITAANFKGVTIGEVWFAWTEDGTDGLANKLRKRFNDRLVGLAAAHSMMGAAGSDRKKVDDLLAFELGGDAPGFNAARSLAAANKDPADSANKRAMKVFKDLSNNNCKYLRPHDKAQLIPGLNSVRVYPLGPPHDEDLLQSLLPVGDEEFHFGFGSAGNYFANAVVDGKKDNGQPFASRYRTKWQQALNGKRPPGFWHKYYGRGKGRRSIHPWDEIESNPPWRRIDHDWLNSAEQLALDMNKDTNNGSLVLAFETKPGGKVLLFAADAQRGNWVSWAKGTWKDGNRTVNCRDLLGRTVLYKVGHHGSHNATLKAEGTEKAANLGWMAEGDYAREFTAMITAVRPWAETQNGWDHPLKAIKDALLAKSSGRVFQTDTDVDKMTPIGSQAEWNAFLSRVKGERLYIDYTVTF